MSGNKLPSDDDLLIAVSWLRINEGSDGEADACIRVADWIEQEAHKRMLRFEARRIGVPVARLRRKLSEKYMQATTTTGGQS